MSGVELKNISKSFGNVRAVSNLSLVVEPGELVALVGPSGCGKTTLLRIIAGFERPDAGNVLLAGSSMISVPPEARRVGIVFQDYALFPHMSVAGNIGYGLRFGIRLGGAEREERVRELLSLVGLTGYGDRRPQELSAGQQQRVAIARAVAPRPDVLLLDEPMSALDALLREELRSELRRLQRELGITTLHVTHDQEEAIAIADRVAVMHDGRLDQVGKPQEVYFKPATGFVARFVGGGNILDARVAEVGSPTITVRLGNGGLVEVTGGGSKFEVGEAVGLVIRPTRLKANAVGRNRIRGEVAGVEFLGQISRLRVRVNDQDVQTVVDSLDGWAQRVGEQIDLGFLPGDAWLLPHRV